MKAKDVRKGKVILHNNSPYKVMDFMHVTPGKGNAVVQTKMRNLITGLQTEVRFGSTEDIPEADVYSFTATYLYDDTEGYHFMHKENYEQVMLTRDQIADQAYYLQPEMEVMVTLFNEEPIGIQLPPTVTLTITDCPPDLKGATATNSPKPATTDTGLQLNVPSFIKIGEKVIVNTEEGSYVSRA